MPPHDDTPQATLDTDLLGHRTPVTPSSLPVSRQELPAQIGPRVLAQGALNRADLDPASDRYKRLVEGAVVYASQVANAARIYDYLLGGKDNFPVDRAAAEQLVKRIPDLRTQVPENRYLLGRVVGEMVDLGVRQFLDLGAGLPTRDNTHEIVARRLREKAKATGVPVESSATVYVDYDEMACVHGQALMTSECAVMVHGDLRTPEKILAHESVLAVIDFTQPVAVLAIAVLHFVTDAENPAAIIAYLRDGLPEGSYLAISHGCPDSMQPEALAAAAYEKASAPFTPRSREEITALFDGWELLEPGVCEASKWRPGLDRVNIGGNGAPAVARSGARFVGGVARR